MVVITFKGQLFPKACVIDPAKFIYFRVNFLFMVADTKLLIFHSMVVSYSPFESLLIFFVH